MSTIEEQMIEHARDLAAKTGGKLAVEVWCWVRLEPKQEPVVNCQSQIGATGRSISNVFASSIERSKEKVIYDWEAKGRPTFPAEKMAELNRIASELGYALVLKDAPGTEAA